MLIKSHKSNIDVNIYIDASLVFINLTDNFKLFNQINNDNLQDYYLNLRN